MVEGAPLLRAYGSKAHRGFESLPLRHTANKFLSISITQSWQPRSGDSNPRYGKGGSTKSPQAILDDAHASPAGRGPKARVYPSLSATKKIPVKAVSCGRMESVERDRPYFYCQPTASYVGNLIRSFDPSLVAARLLNHVPSFCKSARASTVTGAMNAASSEITVSNGGICAERSRTKDDRCRNLPSSRKNSGVKASEGASGIAVCRLANVAAIACARRAWFKS